MLVKKIPMLHSKIIFLLALISSLQKIGFKLSQLLDSLLNRRSYKERKAMNLVSYARDYSEEDSVRCAISKQICQGISKRKYYQK